MEDMINIRTYNSDYLYEQHLDDQIIEFDKKNMGPFLAAWNIPFSEKKRRKGLAGNATFHIAFNENHRIIGYLQYGPHWDDKDAIYISSVQVAPSHRNTSLFTQLVVTAFDNLAGKPFSRLVTNVQKHNKIAIGLYRKLGFTIDEANASETSFPVYAEPSMLDTERLRTLKRN
jgi:ribosomal protein S18 acetylase RimI-like enzyme